MRQVILKNKHGETLGPYEISDLGRVYINIPNAINFPNATPKGALEILGYTIEPYEEPRREWWIGALYWRHSPDLTLNFMEARDKEPEAGFATADGKPWIKAVELREGEIIIDREKLEECWNNIFEKTSICDAPEGIMFKDLCKHLGLEESGE